MKQRGRPKFAMTPRRAQVRTYWRKHGPCSLGQVMRACGICDRATVKRFLRDLHVMGEIEAAEFLPTPLAA